MDNTLERIIKVLADHLGLNADDINGDTPLESFSLDSLNRIELAMALEDAFDIELQDDSIDLVVVTKVEDLVAVVREAQPA